jgi:HD-like signal output (HDOD) protein
MGWLQGGAAQRPPARQWFFQCTSGRRTAGAAAGCKSETKQPIETAPGDVAQIAKSFEYRSAPQAADVLRRVIQEIEKFPALLPVVQKGLAVLENPHATSGQFARILQADPLMVARILRFANSAYFGVMSEVRTVSMAATIIGYRKLGSLLRHILVSGLIELLSQGRPAASRIRETAVAASAASHELAIHCQFDDPEELMVAGLLFNIGELALFWSFPKEYESLLGGADAKRLGAAQEAVFGVDSTQVGRAVLEAWQFPAVFREVVAHWPDPLSESVQLALRRYLAIVHVGVVLARAHVSPIAPQSLDISPAILAELKLGQEDLQEVLGVLPQKIEAVQAILED